MRTLTVVAFGLSASLALVACSKAEPTGKAPPVVKGPAAKAGDPASLPPAGTAPTPVTAPASLAAMWNEPIKTLAGKPTTLDAYKGKALLLVNVASKCGLTPQYEQ